MKPVPARLGHRLYLDPFSPAWLSSDGEPGRRSRDDPDVEADGLRDPDPRAPRAGDGDAHCAGARGALARPPAHRLEAREGAREGRPRDLAPRAERRLRARTPRRRDLGRGDRRGARGAHRAHRVREAGQDRLRDRGHLPRARELGSGLARHRERLARAPPLVDRPVPRRRARRARRRRQAGADWSPRAMTTADKLKDLTEQKYRYGFVTEIDEDRVPPGLSEEIVRLISEKKGEPAFMLEWWLKAYRHWLTLGLEEPTWSNVRHPPIDYQSIVYYSAPKQKKALGSMDEVDPELRNAFQKLGIPLEEQMRLAGVAVDAVFDSVSVATTYKKKLADLGIVFCSFSEAVREHPTLVEKWLGSVVPYTDNFYATLNSAVFSDGSFVYVPKGVRCPMELSTYFRINAKD